MRWMISYRYKIGGHTYDQVQVIEGHPARFLCDLQDTGQYDVVRLYFAIEVPPKTLKRNEGEFPPTAV